MIRFPHLGGRSVGSCQGHDSPPTGAHGFLIHGQLAQRSPVRVANARLPAVPYATARDYGRHIRTLQIGQVGGAGPARTLLVGSRLVRSGGDGEESPLGRYAFEFVFAAVVEDDA